MKLKQHSGFTLIELVIVIVLLGILAATALPKFSNLTTQARLAAARGIAGAMGDAVNIAYASWLASGQVAGAFTLQDGTVVMPNTTTTINPGYPEDAVPAGDTPAATANTATAAKCQDLMLNLLQGPPTVVASPTTCPTNTANCFSATGAGTVCTYTDTGGNVITYDVSTGAVVSP